MKEYDHCVKFILWIKAGFAVFFLPGRAFQARLGPLYAAAPQWRTPPRLDGCIAQLVEQLTLNQ